MRLHKINLSGNGDFLETRASVEGIAAKGFQCIRQLHLFKLGQSVELCGQFCHGLEEAELRELHDLLCRCSLECSECLVVGDGLQLCERENVIPVGVESSQTGITCIVINKGNTWIDNSSPRSYGDGDGCIAQRGYNKLLTKYIPRRRCKMTIVVVIGCHLRHYNTHFTVSFHIVLIIASPRSGSRLEQQLSVESQQELVVIGIIVSFVSTHWNGHEFTDVGIGKRFQHREITIAVRPATAIAECRYDFVERLTCSHGLVTLQPVAVLYEFMTFKRVLVVELFITERCGYDDEAVSDLTLVLQFGTGNRNTNQW